MPYGTKELTTIPQLTNAVESVHENSCYNYEG
jgi:hypothetical protein